MQAEFFSKIENGFSDIKIVTALEKVLPYKKFVAATVGGFTLIDVYDYCIARDDDELVEEKD